MIDPSWPKLIWESPFSSSLSPGAILCRWGLHPRHDAMYMVVPEAS